MNNYSILQACIIDSHKVMRAAKEICPARINEALLGLMFENFPTYTFYAIDPNTTNIVGYISGATTFSYNHPNQGVIACMDIAPSYQDTTLKQSLESALTHAFNHDGIYDIAHLQDMQSNPSLKAPKGESKNYGVYRIETIGNRLEDTIALDSKLFPALSGENLLRTLALIAPEHFHIAIDNKTGEVIGYVCGSFGSARGLRLENAFVAREGITSGYQGLGIGTNLMSTNVASYLKKDKMACISATVHPSNFPSQAMLNKVGFAPIACGVLSEYFQGKDSGNRLLVTYLSPKRKRGYLNNLGYFFAKKPNTFLMDNHKCFARFPFMTQSDTPHNHTRDSK